MRWSGIGREVTEVVATSDGILEHVEEDGRDFLAVAAWSSVADSTIGSVQRMAVAGYLAEMFHGC